MRPVKTFKADLADLGSRRSEIVKGLSLRVFGRLPKPVGSAPMAGVRKASMEETAGRFATALVRAYGDLGAAPDGFSISKVGLSVGGSMGCWF